MMQMPMGEDPFSKFALFSSSIKDFGFGAELRDLER
jgi:hypothetical protein